MEKALIDVTHFLHQITTLNYSIKEQKPFPNILTL